jgi:hypothetical protein
MLAIHANEMIERRRSVGCAAGIIAEDRAAVLRGGLSALRAQQVERIRRIGSLTSLDESDARAQAAYPAFRNRPQPTSSTLTANGR